MEERVSDKSSSDLLVELRACGERDSVGYFSLDRRKAQEKMREFQLVDAHHYVLSLVQAGVAQGASSIAFTVDERSVRIEMRGVQLEPQFFEQPLAGLFIAANRFELEGYRQLSIGINAALSLSPQSLELQQGARRVRVVGTEVNEVPCETSHDGLLIELRERISWRLAGRLWRKTLTQLPECEVLRERCHWCPVELTVNGETISQRVADALGLEQELLLEVRSFETLPGSPVPISGVLCSFVGGVGDHAIIKLVRHGVEIATRKFDVPPLQPMAVLCVNHVLTNASGSDMLYDEKFERILKALAAESVRLFCELCAGFVLASPLDADRMRRWFFEILARPQRAQGFHEIVEALRAVPMFALLSGERVSVDDCVQRTRQALGPKRCLYYMSDDMTESTLPLPSEVPVLRLDANEEVAVELLSGCSVIPFYEMSDAIAREQGRRRFELRSGQARLDANVPWLEALSFVTDHCAGEIGLPRIEAGAPGCERIKLFLNGKPLEEVELPGAVACFEAVVDSAELQPNADWSGVEHNSKIFQSIVLLMGEKYRIACENLARRYPWKHSDAPQVREHLLRLLRRNGLTQGLGTSVLDYPLFNTVSGEFASIADLLRDREEFGALHYVSDAGNGRQSDYRHIVYGGPETLRLLQKLFWRVEDYTRALKAEQVVMAVDADWGAPLTGKVLCAAEQDTEQGHVSLGVDVTDLSKSNVSWSHNKRNLGSAEISLPVGPLRAVVQLRERGVDPREQARVAVLQALPALAAQVAADKAAFSTAAASEKARRFLYQFIAWTAPPLPPSVAAAPLFQTVDGATRSPAEVQALRLSGPLQLLRTRLDAPANVDGPIFRYRDDDERKALEALCGPDGVHDLQSVVLRQAHYTRYRASPPREPKLHDPYLEIEHVTGPGLRGEVGVRAPAPDFKGKAVVEILFEQRLLCLQQFASDLPLRAVVEVDHIVPNDAFDGVREEARDALLPVYAAVLAAGKAAVERIRAVPSEAPHDERTRFLLWLALDGIEDVAALLASDDSLLQRPLLVDSAGRRLSLHELARLRQAEGRVWFVPPGVAGHAPPKRIVCLSAVEHDLLYTVFAPLIDYSDRLKTERWSGTPKTAPLVLPDGPYVARYKISRDGLRGEIGVALGGHGGVQLCRHGAPAETARWFGDLPVVGVLEAPVDDLDAFRPATLERLLDDLYSRVADEVDHDSAALEALLAYYLHRAPLLKSGRAGQLPESVFPPIFEGRTLRQLLAAPQVKFELQPSAEISLFLKRFFANVDIAEPRVGIAAAVPTPKEAPAMDHPAPTATDMVQQCFADIAATRGAKFDGLFARPLERNDEDEKSRAAVYWNRGALGLNMRDERLQQLAVAAEKGDQRAVAVLASALFTCANQALEEITDAHELGFLQELADWLDAKLS